jgi:hypothetical protein
LLAAGGFFLKKPTIKDIMRIALILAIFAMYFNSGNALTVTVTQPNGGETWAANSTQSIIWSVGSTIIDADINANIFYSLVQGARQNSITLNQSLFGRKVLTTADDNNHNLLDGSNPDINTANKIQGNASRMWTTGAANPYHQIQYLPTQTKPDLRDSNAYKIRLNFFTTSFEKGINSSRLYLYDEDSNTSLGYFIYPFQNPPYYNWTSIGNNWYSVILDYNNPSGGTFANFDGIINNFAWYTDTNAGYTANDKSGYDYFVFFKTNNCPLFDGNANKPNISCSYSWVVPDVNNAYIDVNVNNGITTAQDSSDSVFNFRGLQTRIFNERTGAAVTPTLYTIDSNSWLSYCTTNSCVIPNTANISAGYHNIRVGATSYSTRDYNFYFDLSQNNDWNFGLVPDTNSNLINFKFYLTDGTTLAATKIVRITELNNKYFAGQKTTGADGGTSFWLDYNAAKYGIHLFNADGTNYADYNAVTVTTKRAKDEKTSATLPYYSVSIRNLANYDANAISTDYNFAAYANTSDNYRATIDSNDTTYYPRHYYFNVKGNPTTYELQPYLVKNTDGIQSSLIARDKTTKASLPSVDFNITKTIDGTEKMVERVTTDSAGVAPVSWLSSDTYNVYVLYNNAQVCSFSEGCKVTITPYYATYWFDLDLNATTIDRNVAAVMDVNFVPKTGRVNDSGVADKNGVHLEQWVRYDNANIQKIYLTITQGNTTLKSLVYAPGDTNTTASAAHFYQDFNVSGIVKTRPIKVQLIITAGDANSTYTKSYYVVAASENDVIDSLNNLKNDWGDFAVLLLAVFITIGIVGAALKFVPFGTSGAAVIAIISLGFFTFIVDWVPYSLFGFAAFGGIMAMILNRREQD